MGAEQLSHPLQAVLLVDDDKVTNLMHQRQIMRNKLANRVEIATDGCAALELLNEIDLDTTAPPELVLLDINMPRMNGFEFLAQYAELPEKLRDAQHVIMVSTSTFRQDRARAEDDPNVYAFAGKPLSDKDLAAFARDYRAANAD
jgi:CheY-like chemotaxis protein